jgi:hypothetical protein
MPRPDSDDAELHIAIGRVIRNWSGLEFLIDMLTIDFFKDFGGDEVEPEIPYSFKRKLTFIKKCTRKLPSFQGLHHLVEQLCSTLDELADVRHWIAHSMIWRTDEPGVYKLLRFEKTQDRFIEEIEETTPDHIHMFADGIVSSTRVLVAFLRATDIPTNVLDELERKIGGELRGILEFHKEMGNLDREPIERLLANLRRQA